MSQFCRFTQEEFEEFLGVGRDGKPLQRGGFYRISVYNTIELVYGRLIMPDLTLRIYSTIEHGFARDMGDDAIRVCIAWRPSPDEQQMWIRRGLAKPNTYTPNEPIFPKLVGGDIRVHRVMGWRDNLAKRLQNYTEIVPQRCECCGAPCRRIVPRKKKGKMPTWTPFWGCVWYPNCPSQTRS